MLRAKSLIARLLEQHAMATWPAQGNRGSGNSNAPGRSGVCSPELERLLRLALVEGIGPKTWQALIARFGSPAAVLEAPVSQLREVAGVGAKIARRIAQAGQIDVGNLLHMCSQLGIDILPQNDGRFPRLLREIAFPPVVLFVRGSLVADDNLAIAIVGTRHPTAYGLRQAERLAAGLARVGLTIVSGLARGIDQAAHRGALAAGGRTIAVLANGLGQIYPPEHTELAEQIVHHGALLSEAPPQAIPAGGTFPRRNRLISGLSLGTIVVEAGARSGALITARHAMEQGREVFAVPGRVEDRSSRGCHRLIRDGATLVESVDDVLDQLGPLVEPVRSEAEREIHHPAELQLNEVERAVLAAVGSDPTTTDQIIAATGIPVPRVLATLSVLEMRRLLRRTSGNTVVRR